MMIGRTPAAARNLFDSRHDVGGLLTRFQHSVSQRMHQLVPKSQAASPPPTPSCAYQSMFVRPHAYSHDANDFRPAERTVAIVSTKPADVKNSDLIVTGMEGISLLIASFLDGRSLGRMLLVNRSWNQFVSLQRDTLMQVLLQNEFDTIITSSTIFKSYLFSLRHTLDRELAHCRYILHTHAALEEYCTEIAPENHGFVAMFCDIIRFRDPRIARFVAYRRHGALNMVLTATPEHVQAFRRACAHAGPIAFVPFDNPHWPQFDLPPVNFPGFLGYAFDHVEMVKGFEAFKDTVVKSILKEMMLFDTPESAAAYGRMVGKPPFAAIINAGDEGMMPHYHLTFSNPLREELSHLSITVRIAVLSKRIAAVDHTITSFTSQQYYAVDHIV